MCSYDIAVVARGLAIGKFISLASESAKSWSTHTHTFPGSDHLLRDCWSSVCYCGRTRVSVKTVQFNVSTCGGNFHFLSIKAVIKGPFLPSCPLLIIVCIIKLTMSATLDRRMCSGIHLARSAKPQVITTYCPVILGKWLSFAANSLQLSHENWMTQSGTGLSSLFHLLSLPHV